LPACNIFGGIIMDQEEKRIDYLKMRIDHTLTHLQTASKLIYLVDGAVLAFVYFVVNAFGLSRPIALFLSTLGVILAGLNYLHSRFILTQSHWYRENDKRIRDLLKEPDIDPLPASKYTKTLFTSSHRNLKNVHILITFWLIMMSIVLFLYWCDLFEEIQMRNNKG
jgi:hypothetical protein